MLLKVYAIKDKKAEAFGPPFTKNTHGEAERDFDRIVKDEKSMIHQYPEDYQLYHLGEFNNITGKLQTLETPTEMTHALEILNPEKGH